jgi:hypothetical protein
MNRDQFLALYDLRREVVQRILGEAVQSLTQADLTRSAKQLGLWRGGRIVLPEGDTPTDMLSDIALFEPNQRGVRAFDRFLRGLPPSRPKDDAAVAGRMIRAFFSLFRHGGRHETAGIWVEDLLNNNRRLWLMDRALETSLQEGTAFGLRVFDAGEFHMGFGIVTIPDDETIHLCVQVQRSSGRSPFRYSLAAQLYADTLIEVLPVPDGLEKLIEQLLIDPASTSRKRGPARRR